MPLAKSASQGINFQERPQIKSGRWSRATVEVFSDEHRTDAVRKLDAMRNEHALERHESPKANDW